MLRNINPVLLLLIVVTAVVSFIGFRDRQFFERFKFQVNRIKNGDRLRMLSSGFLHADEIHLILNMYALYLFGNIVVYQIGELQFLVVYIGSLLAGSLYSFYFHSNEPYYSAIGASGAVSGIVYCCILLVPESQWNLLFLPGIPIKGYVLGFVYMLYTMYAMKRRTGNIGHSAHLGGAIGGYALTLVFAPYIFYTNTTFVVILSVPVLILIFFGKKLKI
jgi:membrane associated rhomboid family serine protease